LMAELGGDLGRYRLGFFTDTEIGLKPNLHRGLRMGYLQFTCSHRAFPAAPSDPSLCRGSGRSPVYY